MIIAEIKSIVSDVPPFFFFFLRIGSVVESQRVFSLPKFYERLSGNGNEDCRFPIDVKTEGREDGDSFNPSRTKVDVEIAVKNIADRTNVKDSSLGE